MSWIWWYRRVLVLYPRDFRHAFETEMIQVFEARLGHVRRAPLGRWRAAPLVLREISSVLVGAVRERFRGRTPHDNDPKTRGSDVFNNLFKDIRYAVRALVRAPVFALVAVGTLGLGIGANTAIFSVVNGVLLTPPPFESPQELVMVWEKKSQDNNVVNPQNFTAWREHNEVFQEMAAVYTSSRNLTGLGEPRRITMSFVTPQLFGLLGATPILGRTFRPEEIEPGNSRVVIIQFGSWQSDFGGDPDVVGKTVSIQEASYEIIGVMSPEFDFPEGSKMWTPLALGDGWRSHGGRFHTVIARLESGVTMEQAQANMDVIARGLEQERPEFNGGWGVNIVPLSEQMVGDVRQALWILFGAVGFVLLIACANVANLLLARGVARSKEFAIRAALGASNTRLVRQMFTEIFVLTGISLVVGLAISYGALGALRAFLSGDVALLHGITIDLTVLGFTLGIAVITALVFGLVPALHVSRADVHSTLKEGGRTSAGAGGSHRLRSALVISEIMLAMVLLVGAGLLVRSFQRLMDIDVGFEAQNVISGSVQLPGARYTSAAQLVPFFDGVIERLEALPQVVSASGINFLPLAGPGAATSFTADDRPQPAPGESPVADVRAVHHKYFETMQMTLLRGRVFDGRETEDAEMFPIVISRSMAEQLWPEANPIGKTISMPWGEIMHGEVIGVVEDVLHMGLETDPRAKIYWSQRQFLFQVTSFVVRTDANALELAALLKEQVWAIDPDIPLADIRTMDEWLGASNRQRSFSMWLLSSFAAVALLLACVGIYGVISYAVTQRTHEFGLRMALGASPGDVLRLVVGKGLVLAIVAVGIGGILAVGLTRTMQSLLYEVNTFDSVTFVTATVVLVGVSTVASWIPARRATKIDPMDALRDE